MQMIRVTQSEAASARRRSRRVSCSGARCLRARPNQAVDLVIRRGTQRNFALQFEGATQVFERTHQRPIDRDGLCREADLKRSKGSGDVRDTRYDQGYVTQLHDPNRGTRPTVLKL